MADEVIEMFVRKVNRPLSYSIKIVAKAGKIMIETQVLAAMQPPSPTPGSALPGSWRLFIKHCSAFKFITHSGVGMLLRGWARSVKSFCQAGKS